MFVEEWNNQTGWTNFDRTFDSKISCDQNIKSKMFNVRGSRTVTEEESGMDLSSKRASYLERRARLLSDVSVSSSSSHSSEPDPDSLAGMRLRGSPVPSPGGPRNGTRGQAGPSNGVDFADEWSTKGVAKTCEVGFIFVLCICNKNVWVFT